MIVRNRKRRDSLCAFAQRAAVLCLTALVGGLPAMAEDDFPFFGFQFWPGNLVVARSVYDNNAKNIQVGATLPPNCVKSCGTATNDGTYPQVWNNALADGSFGITSKIFLDQMTVFGWPLGSLEVPNSTESGVKDQLVTSFSSKSELGLHLSTDNKYLTFMGYVAPVDAIDISNSNTPAEPDPTNPVTSNAYRAVAQVDRSGKFHFTETNAYSGNNGRAAILNSKANVLYTAGNAGNGGSPQPAGIILGAGAQIMTPSSLPESAQTPGTPAPVGSFSVTELGDKADKLGKDDNFRGIAIFNNVLYYTKGSGGNGVDTVYFVDTTGTACPSGVGVPANGAGLPTTPLTYSLPLSATGLPNNMCILRGFPTALAKSLTTPAAPFGIWFANATTLYVADEGDGTADNAHAAAQTGAGLQKWVLNTTTNTWNLAYTLRSGLNLGQPYTVAGYPTGINPATGLNWSPAADGLRQLTGQVFGDFVTIWATTSTISGSGDQGADPNQLVVIVDSLKNQDATAAAKEKFFTLRTAKFGEVLRGVSLTPGAIFGDE